MSENNVQYWGIVSRSYDCIVDDTIGKNLRPSALKILADEKGLGRAVEFGCGTGYFTMALVKAAGSVVATDFCDEMLARARAQLKDAVNVTIQKEDCMKTSFPDETFDTVFMGLVLNNTSGPSQVLKEARRILKPGGSVIIVNPDWTTIDDAHKTMSLYRFKTGYGEAQARYPQAIGNLSGQELHELLDAAGFNISKSELIRDDSDPLSCAMEYVKGVKASNNAELVTSILKSQDRPENVIQVKYLAKNYGKFTAVCGVSFNVVRGEVFALLGPNGAGKTTIVEILELLKTPTRGYVSIFGNAVLTGIEAGNLFTGMDRDYTGIKEKIGVLPQGFNSFELLTVYENIDYFARMYSKHISIEGLIEELGLKDKRNTLVQGSLRRAEAACRHRDSAGERSGHYLPRRADHGPRSPVQERRVGRGQIAEGPRQDDFPDNALHGRSIPSSRPDLRHP